MGPSVNVQEAKTRLSELLRLAERGHPTVISRAGKPIARLEPVAPKRRDFSGPLFPDLRPIDTAVLFEPMSSAELADWEHGHAGDPLLGGV